MENPIKTDDLGVQLFLETPIYENKQNKSSKTKPRQEDDVALEPTSWSIPGGVATVETGETKGVRLGTCERWQ